MGPHTDTESTLGNHELFGDMDQNQAEYGEFLLLLQGGLCGGGGRKICPTTHAKLDVADNGPGHAWYNRYCALLSRCLVSGAVLEGTRTEESTVVPTEPVAAQQVVPASSPPCTITMEMDV